jgi:hypothetical protein
LTEDPCPVKLGKKEVDKVMGTSKAQSIATSRAQSRKTSRRGSMDDMEPAEKVVPRSKGGKIINKILENEVRDSNLME